MPEEDAAGKTREEGRAHADYMNVRKIPGQDMVTLKVGSETNLGCGRCIKLRNFEEPKLSNPKFYCDCGFRAVMRRIRQEIIIDLDGDEDTFNPYNANESELAERLIQFHFQNFVDVNQPQVYIS